MTLTPVESFWLHWHTRRPGPAARLAQAVLLAAAGKEPGNIAFTLKLKRATVDRTLAGFEQQRLGMLPRPALLLNELLDAARVDMAHARQVADLALQLFEATRTVHQLAPRLRALVEAMALLHNVGVEVDEPQHHTAGRDVLMAMKLAGYSDDAGRMIACAIRFHRKRVRPGKEPLFVALSPAQRAQTLALSALVRIADGLDYSQSQSTRLEAVAVGPRVIGFRVSGPHAGSDAARAIEKADLWAEVFGQAWRLAPEVRSLAQAPLGARSPMSVVIQRALADQLIRWQAAGPGARAGDVAAIKALRAAARRARAALELFQPHFRKAIYATLRPQFKRAEAMLGRVRDWDVLLDGAEAELAEADFIAHWRAERTRALAEAEAWLDSAEAATMLAAWEAALAADSFRPKRDTPLAANAESVVQARLAVVTELAASLSTADLETYHRLRRVGVKRLRFALEFLAPALGAGAEALIKDIVKAQDRLGYLNDACVARDRVVHWLSEHPEDEVARQYALTCDVAIATHVRGFPRDWAAVAPEVMAAKVRALLSRFGERPAPRD
jgi:CHAD domain-containing protein